LLESSLSCPIPFCLELDSNDEFDEAGISRIALCVRRCCFKFPWTNQVHPSVIKEHNSFTCIYYFII
jgi:hypothetical protein